MDPLEYVPFGRSTWRDPYPLYARLRDEDPVHYSDALGIWVLTRFADVYRAVLDPAAFSSAHGISLANESELLELLPTMVMMDPPDHTKYRRFVNKGFSPKRVQDIEPAVREFVAGCVARLSGAGEGDLIAELARPLPCFVVANYLGVPAEDRVQFEGWTQAIVQANSTGSTEGADAALAELYGYFTRLVERRRVEPGDDMVSSLAQLGNGEDTLSTAEILGYAFVMVAGGNDTVTGLVGGAAELLTAHPEQRALLLDDLSLLAPAVDEFLRMTSPVQGLCRVTTGPVTVGGTEIPEGSRVLLCYGAANRDPDEFGPDAGRLDVTRRVKRLLSFSGGPHYCLGAHVARLQGRVALEELLRACPDFAVDTAAGVFADGAFVRRYDSLPFVAGSG
jgi:hypothetical protein